MSSLALKERLEAARRRAASLAERAEEEAETVAGVAIGVAAGGAFGMADERWGEDAIFGTSVPLVAGLGLAGAAIAGYGGKARMAMLEAGKAGLIVEAYKAGSRMYREWDEEEPAGT